MSNKGFKFSEGDLVYLPSDIIMVQITHAPHGEVIKRTSTTDKPTNVILLKNHDFVRNSFKCEVLFNSERWFVRQSDLYSV